MPNTLAHLGLQPILTRAGMPGADLKWIWAGCVLPDVPWIGQRLLRAQLPEVSGLDLRLYAAVQSSLFITLILAAALALLARRPGPIFAILAVGTAIHLVLDATQTKWANGVLLFAPLSWELSNFGLYWPGDWPTQALTALGVGYAAWAILHERPVGVRPMALSRRQWLGAAGLALLYLGAPLIFLDQAERADLHYVATLREVADRPGRPIEIDRTAISWQNGVPVARLSMGPELVLKGAVPEDVTHASIRGTFTDSRTIAVTEIHVHSVRWRAKMTYLGLLVVAGWWAVALLRHAPREVPLT
ncbi:MAG: hypothetical protein AAFU80_23950 [Pseudomonadota bacterium]